MLDKSVLGRYPQETQVKDRKDRRTEKDLQRMEGHREGEDEMIQRDLYYEYSSRRGVPVLTD